MAEDDVKMGRLEQRHVKLDFSLCPKARITSSVAQHSKQYQTIKQDNIRTKKTEYLLDL